MTMHGEVVVAGIRAADLVRIFVRVIVLSVVVTFLGIGLLRMLAAKSVGLMLTMVVAVARCARCSGWASSAGCNWAPRTATSCST